MAKATRRLIDARRQSVDRGRLTSGFSDRTDAEIEACIDDIVWHLLPRVSVAVPGDDAAFTKPFGWLINAFRQFDSASASRPSTGYRPARQGPPEPRRKELILAVTFDLPIRWVTRRTRSKDEERTGFICRDFWTTAS